ncbi:transcription antitermination factor NusB [Lactobacillus sp. DCY120]|uniref:Transcription antitermination protein NusB n=2 Tax=Bombilactobacillus apium TaxID=2675299 RepID=A0A850R205_9LACO|nr:transcription antitermination factor NusB [Bombilactobacillus apium]
MAFQSLFLLSSTETDPETALQQVLEQWQQTQAPDYLRFLVNSIWEDKTSLDQQLKPCLKTGWSLERLSRADLNLLRLGLFEITKSPAIPDKVAINETLELVNQYSDQDSKKFINAILSNFVPESQPE